MASDKEKQARASSHEKSSESRSHNKEMGKSSEKKTQRAKSNRETRGEHHLEAGKSARTTDHATIRRWVEDRGGSPAAVKATESDNDPGLLRINFPGYSGENRLENISWDDFFKKFDEKKLAFLYQDETRDGKPSRFWKFVSREED